MAEKDTMTGISVGALAAAGVITAFIVALLFYYAFSELSRASATFWCGILSLIVAFVFYIAHAITEEKYVTRGITGIFGILGFVLLYLFIGYADISQGRTVLWAVVLSIILIIVLLLVWGMSRETVRQKIREEKRKRTV